MTKEEYYGRLCSDIFPHKPEIIGGMPRDAHSYYLAHRPRFDAHIDIWNQFLDSENIELVYDLGTSVPFTSYYFNVTKGAEVVYGMLETSPMRVNEKVYPITINLCKEHGAFRKADLVICTECLEHLPCNLYKVREFLKSIIRPGGFMLLSFPCGGQNAMGYWRDNLENYDKVCDHLREFTITSAAEFYYGTGWDVLKEVGTFQEAYQATIMNVLLKKPA